MPTPPSVRFGTMGWAYDDWKGPFYARDARNDRLLEQYAAVFDAVEIDATFYGAPRKSTLTGWAAQVPESFRFSAKVPRAITHERQLVDAAEATLDFARLMRQGLGERLAALLLQLPPEFSADSRERLDRFIATVTAARNGGDTVPWVVEFRHASWQETDVVAALEEHGVRVATTERLNLGGPLRYLRLLGIENSVARFDEKQLDRTDEVAAWAERLKTADADTQVFVRNFFEGHAPATLFALRTHLGYANRVPIGQQQMNLF
ncbi:MAG: DUF72 domain-containing protein [Capsulimonadales bacterium]|nr:DUF72 domain-containing protein [Capsulimonadales bacterium]